MDESHGSHATCPSSVWGVGDTLSIAGNIMADVDCGVLPVVDQRDVVVGVITDRDICVALSRRDLAPSAVNVKEVISGEVYSCLADDDIETGLDAMKDRKVRRLVVMTKAGKLEGVLSLDDIVQHADVAPALKAINEHPVPALSA